jgi:hypothetical protein
MAVEEHLNHYNTNLAYLAYDRIVLRSLCQISLSELYRITVSTFVISTFRIQPVASDLGLDLTDNVVIDIGTRSNLTDQHR